MDEIIHIAFDRKNGKYIAYNDESNLFATGVCVESACEAYRFKYYERLALLAAEDHAETNAILS